MVRSVLSAECQDPYAIVVLLQHDLVVVDLLTAGYPCVENPHPMDLHEAPVTCCAYFADCPSDLVRVSRTHYPHTFPHSADSLRRSVTDPGFLLGRATREQEADRV